MRRSLGCLAVIAVADYVILRRPPRWHAIALFDHPAHVATAVLLGGTDPLYLAGSLLPDVDHVPTAFRNPSAGDERPKSHSLLAVAAAAAVSRPLAAGAAAHLFRDLAFDPGTPLLWPLRARSVRIPYAAYAASVVTAALIRSARGWEATRGVTSASATGVA